MENTVGRLFLLLGSAIENQPLENTAAFSEKALSELVEIAEKHDLVHLVDHALRLNSVAVNDKELAGKLRNATLSAVCRYERTQYEYRRVREVFEKAEIAFLPLKGALLRKRYPEPWMRTSSDVDILLHEADLQRAMELLITEYHYTAEEQNTHDVSMFAPGKQHIELHYHLVENGLVNESETVLRDVWETASRKDDYRYWFEMSDEMFYFYHIAHMAKHFQNGGCGVRPFIDLWLLDRADAATMEKRDALLQKGGLLTFTKTARKLCRVWFLGEEVDDLCRRMQAYVLYGGVYGNYHNRVMLQQQQAGGCFRYALGRVFIPLDSLQHYYPILKMHRWLMPLMQVRRWFSIAFGGGFAVAWHELRLNQNVSKEDAQKAEMLLCDVGLFKKK